MEHRLVFWSFCRFGVALQVQVPSSGPRLRKVSNQRSGIVLGKCLSGETWRTQLKLICIFNCLMTSSAQWRETMRQLHVTQRNPHQQWMTNAVARLSFATLSQKERSTWSISRNCQMINYNLLDASKREGSALLMCLRIQITIIEKQILLWCYEAEKIH